MLRSPDRTTAALMVPLLLAAALTGVAAAQERSGDTEEGKPLFVERVEVNVVNVEVFVVDRQGRRVTGLTKDDFEILQDGEPVEITNFFAVAREEWMGRRAEEAAEDGGTELTPPSELPEEQQLNLVVYVDHFNIHPQNRKRALDDLEGFLEDRMYLGDRVMLMGYDGQLQVVQPFTRDWSQVREGLRKLSKAKALRPQENAERRQVLASLQIADQDDDPSLALSFVRSHIQERRLELRRSARALENTVRSMSGLPGRKALLYVSDGLPQRPGEDLYQYMADLFSDDDVTVTGPASGVNVTNSVIESLGQDEGQLFARINREANANQVTLYTVDARGSGGETDFGAELEGAVAEGAGRVALAAQRTVNYQEPLIDMAEATGGSSILNTFNLSDAFYRAGVDFDHFYSLGFRAPSAGDGEYHDVEVRVKRPGFQVRHRKGFVDKSPEQRVADRTLSSLVFEMESNPLGVQVAFGEPERQKRRVFHLPMLVRIPFSQVTLLPRGQVREGRLRIFLAVRDDDGGISDLQDFVHPVEVPADMLRQAMDKDIGFGRVLRVRPGTPVVAIGVWDELSGTESFVHMEVRVEKGAGEES